jgi:hypothetical protein
MRGRGCEAAKQPSSRLYLSKLKHPNFKAQRLAFNKCKPHSHNLTKCSFSIPTPSKIVGGGLKCLPLGPGPQLQFFGQAGQQQEWFSKRAKRRKQYGIKNNQFDGLLRFVLVHDYSESTIKYRYCNSQPRNTRLGRSWVGD